MQFTVNASIVLAHLPLLERAAAVAEHGFTRAEFWWPFASPTPPQADVAAFTRSLGEAGIQLTGLNFYAGDMAAGERGVLCDPARSREFRANVEVVVAAARATGCRHFNALLGTPVPGVPRREQEAAVIANLRFAADALAPLGGVVLVEPLSGVASYPVKTVSDALEVMGAVGRDNVKLLADFYHLAVNGEDVAAVVDAHAAQFGHIQIADAPGRHEPGTGELPLLEWVARAQARGHSGHVSLEYAPSQEDPFAWLSPARRG